MGQMENGTQELESNVIEHVKSSENLAQDLKCEPPTQDKYKIDRQILASDSVEQKDVAGAQCIEMKLVSIEESSDRSKEMVPNQGEFSQNLDAEKREPLLENVKIFSVTDNLEVASQNGMTTPENAVIPLGIASVIPGTEKVESVQIDVTKLVPVRIDVTNDSGHLDNKDRGSSGQLRNRKAKLKGPVTSSWSLRSKAQEKPKAPEPSNTVKEGSANGEKKKRGRKKKKETKKSAVNEFSRTRTHLRYLLHRIKYEQSLIDAYSAEGWKGQSLEKLKPEKELQRAKSHILRYKLKIRALFQCIDQSLAVGKLPASLFDSQGEIDSEDIFCAKCGSKDLSLDNDIILCDGACERGFHQFCLEPPLLKEHIPPGDEGWLCPGCDCKLDCIDMLKDFQGTKIAIVDSWEKIFPEAAEAASGKKLDDGYGSSSDDSEDDDYDPDKSDTTEKVGGDESSSDYSSYFSAPDDLATSVDNEKHLGLPSDDSEDDDFDPSALDQDKHVEEDSSSSDFTSDSEDLATLLEDENIDVSQILPSTDLKKTSTGSKAEISEVGKVKKQSLKDELSYLMETSDKPVSAKRHVERLDYKKLNDETYGNSSFDSSDEDFVDEEGVDEDFFDEDGVDEDFVVEDFVDDSTTRKRRKTDQEKTEVNSPNKTPITKSGINTNDENQKESKHLRKRTRKSDSGGGTNESSSKVGSPSTGTKRSANKRLGEAVTQRLYASFNVNQYPEKAVKENLAKELGLKVQQVSKWFENARWSFHHRPRMESNSTEKPPEPQPSSGANKTFSNQNVGLQESSAVPAQNLVDILVTNASGESSETRKTRKRKSKLDQAPHDITVTNKNQEQNMQVDLQSPQLFGSQGQTRSSNSVA